MFKIGDFSKVCRVPVSALRYYADIGLLVPESVDPFTGYRYYTLDQLPRLNRILALKDLGLSLDQIRRLLDEQVSKDEIQAMLRLKRAELAGHVADEEARLQRIEARLRIIEQENEMPTHDVVLKKLETQRVLSIREVVPAPSLVGKLIADSYGAIMAQGLTPAGAPTALYHDPEFNPERVDVQVAFPVAPLAAVPLPDGRALTVLDLPAVEQAACLLYQGSYDGFEAIYAELGKWIAANGYRLAGAPREVYLSPPDDTGNAITEIQFPVERAG